MKVERSKRQHKSAVSFLGQVMQDDSWRLVCSIVESIPLLVLWMTLLSCREEI